MLRIVIALLLVTVNFANANTNLPKPSQEYLMLSMTKGGTHLLHKLLHMISSNKNFNVHYMRELGRDRVRFPPFSDLTFTKFYSLIKQKGVPSLVAHLNFYPFFQKLHQLHPHYCKFVMVRDLRDICVSTVFYKEKQLDRQLGKNASFDERLHYVIHPTNAFLSDSMFNVEKEAKFALACMTDSSFMVCRFEDLCGENGGGKQEIQVSKIKEIANALNVTLTAEELNYIVDNLWGNSNTFRKGVIGGWKKYFKPSHVKALKKHLGTYLEKMGYTWD